MTSVKLDATHKHAAMYKYRSIILRFSLIYEQNGFTEQRFDYNEAILGATDDFLGPAPAY